MEEREWAEYALRRLTIHAQDPTEAMGVLLDRQAVAEWLGLRPATLDHWRHERRGPRYIKLGVGKAAHVRYVVADVIAWLAAAADDGGGGPNGAAGPAAGA